MKSVIVLATARASRLVLLFAAPFATLLTAQTQWRDLVDPAARTGHALAFDSVRGCTVLFGGRDPNQPLGHALDDTWEATAGGWIARAPAQSPPPRTGCALAFDSARGRTVLFGGLQLGFLADTWEWDGNTWSQANPAASPPAREGHAMAYDSLRGRTVLFGGNLGLAFGADTWEWDGNGWTSLGTTASTRPSERSGHRLAFDSTRGCTVLFGGYGSLPTVNLGDTWEWNGSAWTQRTPAVSPPARTLHALAFDSARNRTVLFGGQGGVSLLADTWEWDGSSWTQITSGSVAAREGHALAYDALRGRTVLFGGRDIDPHGDTWEWDGTSWTLRPTAAHPSARIASVAWDDARGRAVLFGGYDGTVSLTDTWEWDGNVWQQLFPASQPAVNGPLVFDAAGNCVLLFGGARLPTGAATSAATWTWNGSNWTQRAPAHSPPARSDCGLACDLVRQRIVLFGGWPYPFFDDTWEWDGNDWTQAAPVHHPSGRYGHGMAYDRARSCTVLHGGTNSVRLNDTWEWDGSDWTSRTSQVTPPYRLYASLAYDAARSRTVLFGGAIDQYTSWADTWEWDGSAWTVRSPLTSPRSRTASLAYDSARGRTVLFGGARVITLLVATAPYAYADTWVYASLLPGSYTPFGSGCAGSAGTPQLGAGLGQLPYAGGPFTIEVSHVPASALVFLNFGFSNTAWGATPLPLSLGGVGMPGCAVLASPDFARVLVAAGGTASTTIAIPAVASLQGLVFYNQALVFDAPANPAGLTVSDAAVGTVGAL